MKTTLKNTLLVLLSTAVPAFAAASGEQQGSGLLLWLFIGFGALILVFQLFPGLMLFFSMLKGLFSSAPQEAAATASDETGKTKP